MSLGTGLFQGIVGVVGDPVKGAQQEGVAGFFKGFGKGLLGVVAKPTSGVLDLAGKTLKGLGNTPRFILQGVQGGSNALGATRIRYPRYISPASKRIEVYNVRKAREQFIRDRVRQEKEQLFF